MLLQAPGDWCICFLHWVVLNVAKYARILVAFLLSKPQILVIVWNNWMGLPLRYDLISLYVAWSIRCRSRNRSCNGPAGANDASFPKASIPSLWRDLITHTTLPRNKHDFADCTFWFISLRSALICGVVCLARFCDAIIKTSPQSIDRKIRRKKF